MISLNDALAAVKTDDIGALKQHIRECLAAARCSFDGNVVDENVVQSKTRELLSMRDSSPKRSSLLHWAAYLGNEVAVRLLAHYGADVNAEETDGKTPLHWAAFEGHKSICEYLLHDRNANFELTDLMGNTPCHLALTKQHMDIARLFPNYRGVVVGEMQPPARAKSPSRRTAATTEYFQSRSASTSSIVSSSAARLKLEGSCEPPEALRLLVPCQTAATASTQTDGSSSAAKAVSSEENNMPPNLSARASRSSSVNDDSKKTRKESKRQQLISELFAQYVSEAPTPQKPILWVPRREAESLSRPHVNAASAAGRPYYESSESLEPQELRVRPTPHPSPAFANLSVTTRLPDVSLDGRSRTPTRARSPSLSNSARPSWKPPSRVLIHPAGQRPLPDEPIPEGTGTLTVSRMDVRSY